MNIFVAKLGRQVTSDDLTRLFSTFGEVKSAKIINDKMTGASKGYGFVEMESEDAGELAINSLNETNFMETEIVVKRAHPRDEDPPRRKPMLTKRSQGDDPPAETE
jgi:RNA recognition motif-containing protein